MAYSEPADRALALNAIRNAVALRPLADYRYRLAFLLEKEEPVTSREIYRVLVGELRGDSAMREQVEAGIDRLDGH